MHIEEDVTELEFTVLATSGYSNKATFFPDGDQFRLPIGSIEQSLLDRRLLKWKTFRTQPNKNCNIYEGEILTCTTKGKKVLKKDLLRLVLTLADLEVYAYNTDFHNLVNQLPKEQLPTLLTHNKSEVRLAARSRMAVL